MEMSLTRLQLSNTILDWLTIILSKIASVIGTGLFLAIGKTLSYTGPLGLLLVFAHVGTVAFA